MNPEIRKYNSILDYEKLMNLIKSEGDEWKEYLNPIYIQALEKSICYVAVVGEEICGYSRSISDSGIFLWVIDLLVHKNHRGFSIGKKLMDCILNDFPDIDVYVMSDVDPYYEKLAYTKEGSIFKLKRSLNNN